MGFTGQQCRKMPFLMIIWLLAPQNGLSGSLGYFGPWIQSLL